MDSGISVFIFMQHSPFEYTCGQMFPFSLITEEFHLYQTLLGDIDPRDHAFILTNYIFADLNFKLGSILSHAGLRLQEGEPGALLSPVRGTRGLIFLSRSLTEFNST